MTIGIEDIPKQNYVFGDTTKVTVNLLFKTAFIAPIIEEFIFRKFMLDRFETIGKVTLGIISSSVIFGIMHPLGILIPLFILTGVSYSLIYLKTKSLIITIILHMVNNFSVIFIKLDEYFWMGALINFIFPVIFLFGILYLSKKNNVNKAQKLLI